MMVAEAPAARELPVAVRALVSQAAPQTVHPECLHLSDFAYLVAGFAAHYLS
jgi:hypothetical protein